jgi:DNA helicase II / ATP-dependent DNA helicase PcrA
MDFQREYNRLNQQQQKAVDTIDGPLLVIAGPGTGKTQLLSLRVANILARTDASPENVLCLTFTNKAANNMRSRLTSLVGPEGSRVPIRTFHSFAAELMNLYPEFFWNGAKLTNVPDAVQLEIITSILGSLPLSNPLALKFAGAFTGVRDVQDGLRLAKEAGLTPDKLRSLIQLNVKYLDIIEPQLVEICSQKLQYKKLDDFAARVAELPDQTTDETTRPLVALTTVLKESFAAARAKDEGTNKTTHVSKWKARLVTTVNGQKGMFDERKRNAWWLSLCDVYQKYRDHLHTLGYYDYADMIIEVITQLEHHPDMLASAQERFQYVLIDEFQDTNAAQLRLAHLIADHYTAEGKPNIMVVGDDDQSIYKFNGAELSNMLGFRRSYPTCDVVVLTDNYRSSQAVLDFSEQIITQASERVTTREADIQKVLVARNEPKSPGTIRHISYPTADHQYHSIATEIAATFNDKAGSVAVLARSHESLRRVAATLQQANIPIRYEQQQSVLDQEAVQQTMLVARVAVAIASGDQALVNQYLSILLCHPVWKIPAETMWRLAIQNRTRKDWLGSLLEHSDEHLQTMGQWFLWLGQQSQQKPLPRMLEHILGLVASDHMTSPIREYFLQQGTVDTPYIAALSGMRQLLGLAQDFSKQGHSTVSDLIRLVDVTLDNGNVLADESLFVSAPHAVELMTIHKAKGLEFDSIFIIDAMDSIWRPINNGRKPPVNLPLKPSGDDLDDYIRLMFVAVTRAKQNVTISSFYTTTGGEATLPSAIIRDILETDRIDMEQAAASKDVLESSLLWPQLEGSAEKLLLHNILEGFSLSATGLLDFLDVTKGGPQYFLERHLLRLPEAGTPASAFGSAMHSTLEYAQQRVCEDNFALQKTLAQYQKALKDQYLSPADYDRYLLHGQQLLAQLFEHLDLQPTGQPEVRLANIPVGTARLTGVLDRVDTTDTTVLISDYKTSKPLSSLTTKDKTKQVKAWRHRTQLQFYTLLAQESRQFSPNATYEAQMIYLEAETPKELFLRYVPSPEELDRLRRLIRQVWSKITTHAFVDIRLYTTDYQGIELFEQDLLDSKL